MFFSLLFSKIKYLWPVIIPQFHFCLFELIIKLCVTKFIEVRECYIIWTLNNWLTVTVNRKVTIKAISNSKLFTGWYNIHIFTIPQKNTTLARCTKYKTILTIINVYIGSDVENVKNTIFTVIYIELLLFNWIDIFNSERICKIDKSIIVWIVLFSLERVLFFFWWLFLRWFNDFLLNFYLHFLLLFRLDPNFYFRWLLRNLRWIFFFLI
jgi:hypothetical protein